jgi:hypothetical protein
MMDRKAVRPDSMAQRLVHELRQYAEISVYLYICFGALLFYKLAILNGRGISYVPYGTAAIKALVIGKFILLGHMAGLGDRYEKRRAVFVIVHKSVVFLAMLLALSVIEEIVVGLLHGHGVAASLATFLGGSSLQILATCIIMLLILAPYFAFVEFREALGEARLRQLLFEPRAGSRSGGVHEATGDGLTPSSGQDVSDRSALPFSEKP